ncbi:MAG: macro domain-containing protein, partial [Polyangiales bacterium]
LEACRAVPELRPGVRCPTGQARITPAFALAARSVIHTVGPVYRGKPQDEELLASAFRAALSLAVDHELESVAFPAISCGVYSYPLDEAAAIARAVTQEQAWALREIRFVLFSEEVYSAWVRAFA